MLADVVFRPEVVSGFEWGEFQALGALAASDIPVLAIAGADDRATPPEAARRIAETAPRGELLMIDGTGHFPFAEAPERYWPPLEEWLLSTSGEIVVRLVALVDDVVGVGGRLHGSAGAAPGPSTVTRTPSPGSSAATGTRGSGAPSTVTSSEVASAMLPPELRTNTT